MKKVFKLVSNLILIISLIFTIFLLIPLIPAIDKWYQLAIVKSASMEPWLSVGSLAIYQTQANYEVGQVIAYQVGDGADSMLVMHRIMKKEVADKQILFLTQGDAAQYLTAQPVLLSQVKGKVIGSIPQLGFIFGWLQSQWGSLLMIGLCLILLVGSQLILQR